MRKQIATEAVDWFLQFQEMAVADADRRSFSEWLLRSPAHVEEYLRVSSSWHLMNVDKEGSLAAAALVTAAKAHHETGNVVALPTRLSRRPAPAGADSGRDSGGGKWRPAVVTSLLSGIATWASRARGWWTALRK
jgi:ferric-dicitrate binding protein FerR (iron transport regulator)